MLDPQIPSRYAILTKLFETIRYILAKEHRLKLTINHVVDTRLPYGEHRALSQK